MRNEFGSRIVVQTYVNRESLIEVLRLLDIALNLLHEEHLLVDVLKTLVRLVSAGKYKFSIKFGVNKSTLTSEAFYLSVRSTQFLAYLFKAFIDEYLRASCHLILVLVATAVICCCQLLDKVNGTLRQHVLTRYLRNGCLL